MFQVTNEKLQETTKSGDVDEVMRLLGALVIDRHYYDADQSSKIAVATGICLDFHEEICDVMNEQTGDNKSKLGEIYKKYSTGDPNLKHLRDLFSFSKLCHEGPENERSKHLQLITKAFDDLNRLIWIEPVLKVASTASNLQFVFDFNGNLAESSEPTKCCGVVKSNCVILIGARGLLDNEDSSKEESDTRCEVLAVLARELCRAAMKLICNNHESSKMFEQFPEISDAIRAMNAPESFIKEVFDYPPSQRYAELIAYVAYLVSLHKDDKEKLDNVLLMQYSQVFHFYSWNVSIPLHRVYPSLTAKNKTKKVNNALGGEAQIDIWEMQTLQDIGRSFYYLHAVENCHTESLKIVLNNLETFMTDEPARNFLLQKYPNGSIRDYYSLNGRRVPVLIGVLKKAFFGSGDIKAILLSRSFGGSSDTALDSAILLSEDIDFDLLKQFCLNVFDQDEMRRILLGCEKGSMSDHNSDLQGLLNHFRILCRYPYYLKMRIFQILTSLAVEVLKLEKPIIFETILLSTDAEGNSFLMKMAEKACKEDFSDFLRLFEASVEMERKEILKTKNARSECIFHSAAKNKNVKNFEIVAELYRESFEKAELMEIVSSCDKRWLADVALIFKLFRAKTLPALCNFLKDLFKGTNEAESLESFFVVKGRTSRNAFALAIGENFKHLANLAKELFTIQTYKALLSPEVFFNSLSFVSRSTFKEARKIYEEVYDEGEMREIILKPHPNIIAYCLHFRPSNELLRDLCDYVFKLLEGDKETIKGFFTAFNRDHQTILMDACKTGCNLEYLVEIITKYFDDEDDKRELLIQSDSESQTAFHFVLENSSIRLIAYELVRKLYFETLGREGMKNLIAAKIDWGKILIHCTVLDQFLVELEDLFDEDKLKLRNIFLSTIDGR